jgi:hypothetical protein
MHSSFHSTKSDDSRRCRDREEEEMEVFFICCLRATISDKCGGSEDAEVATFGVAFRGSGSALWADNLVDKECAIMCCCLSRKAS